MERWAALGPGARNRVLPCFRRQGAYVIFGPMAWRRPGRFTRAPGGTVSSAGGRAPGCLCARLRLSRFDSRSQSLGPRRARRPETPRTPGFRPGQSRSTGPRRRFGAWVPRRLSCDGDSQRVAHRRARSGRTVREMVGALKGLGNLAAAIIAEAFDLALIRLPGEAEERKRPLSRVVPILGSSRRMTGSSISSFSHKGRSNRGSIAHDPPW